VVEAIRRASASIDQRYADAPGVAARLHLSIARAFHQRSDFDFARREYDAADQQFARAGEGDSDDAVVGRLNRIAMESVSGQPDRLTEAGRLLAEEKARLGARGSGGRVGFALAQAEGSVGYSTDVAAAESAFRRAVEIAAAPESGIPATQRLKMRSSLALTLMRQGRSREAEPMARAIVQDSIRVRGANHPDTLVARQHLLTSLAMQGKSGEALQGSTPLLAAMEARFGRDHRFTLALRSTRFESYSMLGRYTEAAREAERVWQGAAAQAGAQSHQALVGQIDYASALCRTDQRTRAVAVAQDALAAVRAAFGPDYPLTHSVRYFAAECLIADRRFAEAGALLVGLDRRKVAELTGQTDFDALVDLALAEVALGGGDRAGARTLLTAASGPLRGAQDPGIRERLAVLSRTLAGP
jgi:non-specific serine/threonine protein kinase